MKEGSFFGLSAFSSLTMHISEIKVIRIESYPLKSDQM
jgi:hypothetical protein